MADSKPENPLHVRTRKMRPDGRVGAFSIEEQWDQVEAYKQYLDRITEDEAPVLFNFSESWNDYFVSNQLEGVVETGKDLRRVSSSPLSAFFFFIDNGFIPPPELMLALLDCWDTYTANGGSLSLEEAFFGPPIRGAGNYASRTKSRHRGMFMRWEFDTRVRQGMTRIEAAEAVSELWGGKPDAESILRMFRSKAGG